MKTKLTKFFFLWFIILDFSWGTEINHSKLLEDYLPLGIHQYRIQYSLTTKPDKIRTTTLLGCYHSMLFSSLKSCQQNNLERIIAEGIGIGNECVNLYHTRKLKRYTEILFNLAKQSELIQSNFFTTFTHLRFPHEENQETDRVIQTYFANTIKLFLSEEATYVTFMEEIGLSLLHYPIELLKIFEDEDVVAQLPPFFLYDFVNCHIKHTALESYLIRKHLYKNKGKSISLDAEKAYLDREAPLFSTEIPDFSALMQENSRLSLLEFYSNPEWLFLEEPIVEKVNIPEITLTHLKLLCYIGQRDRQTIFNTVITRRFMNEPHNTPLKRAYPDLYLDMHLYNLGSFAPEESSSNIQRNIQWICGPLKQLLSASSYQNSLIMFGANHLGTLKKGKGILNFLFDLWVKQHQDLWGQMIGQENLDEWNTSLCIHSMERLNRDGEYKEIKLTKI